MYLSFVFYKYCIYLAGPWEALKQYEQTVTIWEKMFTETEKNTVKV
jgi:hypothetical protein